MRATVAIHDAALACVPVELVLPFVPVAALPVVVPFVTKTLSVCVPVEPMIVSVPPPITIVSVLPLVTIVCVLPPVTVISVPPEAEVDVVVDVVNEGVVDVVDVVGVVEVPGAPGEAELFPELPPVPLDVTVEETSEGNVIIEEVSPKTEPPSESVCTQCDSLTVIVGLTAPVTTGQSS